MNKDQFYYTYILQSLKDKKWYTGYAKDLRNRFMEHQKGQVFSTKGRGSFRLIYYEACLNKEDAIAREKYLKSGMGKRYLRNRIKRFLLFPVRTSSNGVLTGFAPATGSP